MSVVNNTTPFLHLGMLMTSPMVELLDTAAVGLFDEWTTDYFKAVPDELASVAFKENALNMTFHWIIENGDHARTTAGAEIKATDSYESCPQLDFILIPGGDLNNFHFTQGTKQFIDRQVNGGLYALMSICSGCLVTLSSGIMDGKKATAPKDLIPGLQEKHPTVKLSAKRWEMDVTGPLPAHAKLPKTEHRLLGNFDRAKNGTELWSSGQVLNGFDMVAHFLRQKFPKEYVDWVMYVSDWDERSREYPEKR